MRSPRALAPAALAVALLVAGCSDGSDGDAAPTTIAAPPTSGATSTTAAATTTSDATTTSEATTTTTEPAAAPTLDELSGASIPAMCQHPAATLVDGVDTSLSPDDGAFRLLRSLPGGGASHVAGVPSEAGPLTAVVAECNAGGVGWPNPILFFGAGGTYYGGTFLTGPSVDETEPRAPEWEQAWADADAAVPGRNGVTAIALDGDTVVVDTSAELADDSSCCPSGSVRVRIVPVDGRIDVVEITRTGAG